MASASDLTNYFGPISACAIGLWTLWKYRTGRAERAQAKADRDQLEAIKGDANLRDDQRAFMAVLQNENREWRTQVEALRATVASLRDDIDALRRELAAERRAREGAEARYLEILEHRAPPVNLIRQPPPDAE